MTEKILRRVAPQYDKADYKLQTTSQVADDIQSLSLKIQYTILKFNIPIVKFYAVRINFYGFSIFSEPYPSNILISLCKAYEGENNTKYYYRGNDKASEKIFCLLFQSNLP